MRHKLQNIKFQLYTFLIFTEIKAKEKLQGLYYWTS